MRGRLVRAAVSAESSSNIRLGNMFWDSVGINFPTTLLMFWSFAILILKSRQLQRQKSAMLMDLLPNEDLAGDHAQFARQVRGPHSQPAGLKLAAAFS